MTQFTEAAAELRRIEAMVAEQFAAIPKPTAPDPRPAETVENVAIAAGVIAVWAGLFLT